MTNMPVLDKNSAMQNILSAKGTKPATSSGDGSFDAVLKQTTVDKQNANPGKGAETVREVETKGNTENTVGKSETNESGNVEEKAGSKDVETQTRAEETQEVSEDITEDTEALERAGGEMAAMLAAQMEIPLETVREAMEELEMTDVSLLDPKNVKDLMVHLTEGADDMSLLTDETFYHSVTDALSALEKITDKLQEETGLNPEELKEAVAAFEKQIENTSEMTEEISVNLPETEKTEEPVRFNTPKPELTENARTETIISKDMPKQESTGKDSESPFMANSYQTQHLETDTVMQAAETESAFSMADTQEIMDQILDYMKVSVKPELTSLEMQLHPESLGTLHIQISNREGAVTAQFIAQNEAVKAVLESQVMELRVNLEQQGLKVEAVEVTIAQYSLDRNPEGDREASEQSGGRKRGSRNLNLKDLDLEEEEDLTQEERLTAEMMQSQGNTVNYTV